MGINSTEVSYGFGQMGSLFLDGSGAASPPDGKVFIAITFLADTIFDGDSGGLVSQTAIDVADGANTGKVLATSTGQQFPNTVEAAHNASDASETSLEGSGGVIVDASNTFPKGVTIYGRWTQVGIVYDADGMGIICYFGPGGSTESYGYNPMRSQQ